MTDTTFKMFINCIHKEKDLFKQAKEENKVVGEIAKLLTKNGYTFAISEQEVK